MNRSDSDRIDAAIRTANKTGAAGRQCELRILGVGHAVLSGGTEAHFNPPGDKCGWRTIGVLLCGVQQHE